MAFFYPVVQRTALKLPRIAFVRWLIMRVNRRRCLIFKPAIGIVGMSLQRGMGVELWISEGSYFVDIKLIEQRSRRRDLLQPAVFQRHRSKGCVDQPIRPGRIGRKARRSREHADG